ncbi:MAG TPA: hypothetical protein VFK78_10440 [Gemmatimonadales bacterium]|nr:hypothetical protein [Gemmatimonadales bacterium]
MKYFHRTTVPPARVLDAARAFFGQHLSPAEETPLRRAFAGALGKVQVSARAEGGHYTFIEVASDQVGESELDKLAKRFLAEVHREAEPTHEVRGAY